MTVPAPVHKTCRSCDTPKPETAYHWRNRARGVRHSICKACRCEDERRRHNVRKFSRAFSALVGPPPWWVSAPTNPPLPWGYGMTPEDVAAIDGAAEGARHIPATTPASVVDPTTLNLPMGDPYWKTTAGYNPAHSDVWNYLSRAGLTPDPDPMGDGSAWGWVAVATVGAFVALVAIVVWVSA